MKLSEIVYTTVGAFIGVKIYKAVKDIVVEEYDKLMSERQQKETQ